MSPAYEEYLQSDHWQEIRRQAHLRARHRCQVCNVDEDLCCHHRSYERIGTGAELADVIVLCRRCHEAFHRAGCLPEPDWTDRANRQRLYKAIEKDRANKRIDAAYSEKEWTIITATRPDNCRACGRIISVGDRIRYGGTGQVYCLGACA